MAWDVDATRLAWHLGRSPSPETIREIGPAAARRHDEPGEDPEEGCPGGWRYARFGYLVQRYARRRTSTGDRVANPNFDRIAAENTVLADAVMLFEAEQERCLAYCERKAAEQRRRELEAERKKRT